MGFNILTLIKSGCIFFLKGYFGLMTWVMNLSIFDFFIRLSLSYDPGSEFDELT